jgi:triacylglycerol lipase
MTVPRLQCPLVLVHGLFGFDQVRMGPWILLDYFKGIPSALRAVGNRVLLPRVSPTGSIADRAAQLRAFLDREAPGEPVHLIGHSMGGLDSRYLIAHLGMASRVLSLTTLGTPHRGSPFADWALVRFERLVAPLFDRLGVPRQAFRDLTVERCKRFNDETPDVPGVRYFSVAGHHRLHWTNPAWGLSFSVVADVEGPNDGIVSLASAKWGEALEVWDADHMNLVNWPQPWAPASKNNRLPFYAALLERLRGVEELGSAEARHECCASPGG